MVLDPFQSSSYLANDGYWGSYNIPYFKEVYDVLGTQSMFEKFGDLYSYEKCPRSQIFSRDAPNVKTIDDAKHIILYNDYLHDPLQLGDPALAIASRYDLRNKKTTGKDPKPFGGIDGKITTLKMMKAGANTWAHSGPTSQGLPPFSWKEFPDVPHYGQMETYDFDWIYLDEI